MEFLRDRKDDFSLRGIVAIIAAILIGAVAWQILADPVEQPESLTYTTPEGEVSITYPADWEATDTSFEEEGYYSLELDGPRNRSISRQINEKYDVNISAESVTDAQFLEILEDPLANEYIIGFFDVVSALQFDIPTSPDEWRDQLLEEANTASRTSYSEFEPFEASGAYGYKYTTQVFNDGQQIETLNYYLLGASAQLEATFYPTDSNNIIFADEIMESVVIRAL